MLKRVAILLFCLIMIFIATFGFVVGVVSVPTIYSYAAVNDDPIYVPLREQSDLVIAFQSYCKSRDLTIEGSLSDAVTTFTTGAFNSACNELGINITQLQAEIKAEYDQSGAPVKFLFNDTGIMAMNRIFAQFLQDNELEVGEQVDEEVVNGYYFTDADGNSCYCYVLTNAYRFQSDTDSTGQHNFADIISKEGTPYKYTIDDFRSVYLNRGSLNYSVHLTSSLGGNLTNRYDEWSSTRVMYMKFSYNNREYQVMGSGRSDITNIWQVSQCCIFRNPNGDLYFGVLKHNPQNNTAWQADSYCKIASSSANLSNNVIVNITTNNNVINNNNYEGDTYITNEGDVIVEPDPVPPGGTDPGWDIGGGGGTATDGDGNTWNIQFPDFQLPDLNIDWSINGLGEKFPFSIPFDLVALVTVLNAEPQAPRFEGTVNFGFTTWDYDINLQQFDSVAQACRIAELLLLVVGLILITRSIIKG